MIAKNYDVYLLKNGIERSIDVNGRQLELNKLKPARRDTKGTKVRI